MIRLVLLPFSAWAAIHFFAASVDDRLIRAEGLFLAPTVAALVAVLLGVAPRPRLEAPAVAVLATAVVWSVHTLSTPAAAIGVMVAAALTVAVARRLAADGWELDLPALCALGVGLQILLRPELFLAGPSLVSRLLVWLLLPLTGAVATFALQRTASSGGLLAAVLAVVVGGGWSPSVVLSIAAAAAASWALTTEAGHRRLVTVVWPIAAVAFAGLLFIGVRGGWPGGPESMTLLALLLPTLAWSALQHPRRVLPLLVVALAALAALPAPTALVPVLAFAGLALPRRRPLLAAQGAWSAIVIATALLLAGYPWLRDAPVVDALSLFGGEGLEAAAVAIAAALALGAATVWSRSRRLAARVAPEAVLALALLAVAVHLPPTGTPLVTEPVVLRAEETRWTGTVPTARGVRTVVVDSYLTYATKLPAGAPVARVTLEKDGRELAAWTLRAGRDTGEWAARRPDIAADPAFTPAPGWIAWVQPERHFFAQRHRARLIADMPVAAAEVTIERTVADDDVELVLTHVETRRDRRWAAKYPGGGAADAPAAERESSR